MPTVRRAELNSEDIVAERGLHRMRRSRDTIHPGAVGSPISQCVGKAPYLNKEAADQQHKRRRGFASYRCRFCRSWHVGGKLDR